MPTVILGGSDVRQFPEHCEFQAGERWPDDLTKLFDEAAKSFSATAYTSTSMVCRKILMSCACREGAKEGESFAFYVDYIIANVFPLPKAKSTIDAIRQIGNEANHKVAFVTRDDAKRALKIINYLLTSIYSLPDA